MAPMASTSQEAIGSMGDDTPLAVLSNRPKPLYAYFRQLFAQVTNPPIDPIRERAVMSLDVVLGCQRNWLAETPEHAHVLHHAAQSVEYSMTGFPQAKPAWFRATVGSYAFALFNARGQMSHALDEPIPGAPPLAEGQALAPAIDRALAALRAFERHAGTLAPHFAYGAPGANRSASDARSICRSPHQVAPATRFCLRRWRSRLCRFPIRRPVPGPALRNPHWRSAFHRVRAARRAIARSRRISPTSSVSF